MANIFQIPANTINIASGSYSNMSVTNLLPTVYDIEYTPLGVNSSPNVTLNQNDIVVLEVVQAENYDGTSSNGVLVGKFGTFQANFLNLTGTPRLGFFIVSKKTNQTISMANPAYITIDTTVSPINLGVYIAQAFTAPATEMNSATPISLNFTNIPGINRNFVDLLSAQLTANNFDPETQMVVLALVNISATNPLIISQANNSSLFITATLLSDAVSVTGIPLSGRNAFVNQDGVKNSAGISDITSNITITPTP